MRSGHAHRFWMIGGALGAVVMLAVGWFFLISPQYGQTRGLHDETAAAELHRSSLQHRLIELRRQSERLPEYRAQLARDRRALPTEAGLSDFLRELQAAGDRTGVSVTGVTVGAPTEATGGTKVYALPITLTAEGSAANLGELLDQLQQVQPRALLIGSTNAVPAEQNGTLGGTVTLTLTLTVFVAPADTPGKTN